MRRSQIALMLLAPLAFLLGCENPENITRLVGEQSVTGPAIPLSPSPKGGTSHSQAPQQYANVGYGLADFWTYADPETFATQLRAAGLGRTVIDLHPKGTGNASPSFETIRRFIESMRRQGIFILIHAINLNNPGTNTPESVADLAGRIARELGPSGIVMEVPESVPSGPWFDALAAAWPGDLVGRNIQELHRCSSDPKRGGNGEGPWPTGQGILFVTDCTDSLTNNAGAIAAWAKRTGEMVIVYDPGKGVDLDVLTKMQTALQ